MKLLRKISGFLNHSLGYVTFAAFFVIMGFIVVNVFMRFVFKAPILGAFEIVEQMMFVGVFASFAYAQQQGSHIRVTMLLLKLPKPVTMFLCGLTSLLGAVCLGILTNAAYKQFALAAAKSYTSAMLKFPLAPFYFFEILCTAIFCLAVAVDAVEYFCAVFNKNLADELAAKL